MKRLRIGVIYGGRSGEHEVSVASAAAVIGHLDPARYDVIPIRIDRDGRWTIPDRPPTSASAGEVISHARRDGGRPARAGREAFLSPVPAGEVLVTVDRGERQGDAVRLDALSIDVAFPVLHGPYGEDGTVQGLFELADVPYVGAGVAASAAGMDKAIMRTLFAARGLPVADWEAVLKPRWEADPIGVAQRVTERLGFPLFVKPANLGSSLGITKVKRPAELAPAFDLAFAYDRKAVAEAAVAEAREIECSVVGNDAPEASEPGEVRPSREFYDYEAKYLHESPVEIPADLPPAVTAEVRRLAVEAFLAIDAAGMARVDFLVARRDHRVWLNEINTIPGFTTISMFPKLWEASGLPYPALLDRLIELALQRHARKRERRLTAF
jgi:D-alanine-D-alanine ligase